MTMRSYFSDSKKKQWVMGKETSELRRMMNKPLEVLEWNRRIALRRILGKQVSFNPGILLPFSHV